MSRKRSKVWKIPIKELTDMIINSYSYSEVMRKLGYKYYSGGNSYGVLKQRIEEENIDVSHFKKNGRVFEGHKRVTNEEAFTVNSKFCRCHLKTRIIRENLLDYICDECGNTGDWNNKKLVLELDHINGIGDDNRLKNLRFLCPNCHSQTKTFSGKNNLRV